MSSLLSLCKYQPFNAFYTIFAITFNAARLPLWLVYYIPVSLRQNPAWSFKQAVRVRLIRAFVYFTAIGEYRISMSKKPGAQKDRYVVHAPAIPAHLTGYAVKDPEVVAGEVGGTWYPAKPDGKTKPGNVVLHFHGGAFAIGDGRDEDAGFAAKTILKNTDATHVFCPQYRLVTHPKSRFPAQLQDSISSYTYLLYTIGIEPSKIIASGDSAGGNMVLGLLRYIADFGTTVGLPTVGCAWLWSPWPSPHDALYRPEQWAKSPLTSVDYVTPAFGMWGARNLEPAKSTGMTLDHPAINFEGHPFPTETPIWIQTGSSETLYQFICKLYEELRHVKGNKVDIHVSKHAPHDIILIGDKLGFETEATNAAVFANEFLRNIKA